MYFFCIFCISCILFYSICIYFNYNMKYNLQTQEKKNIALIICGHVRDLEKSYIQHKFLLENFLF